MNRLVANLFATVIFVGVLFGGILVALITSSFLRSINPQNPTLEGLGALFLFGFSTLGAFLAIWGASRIYDAFIGKPKR